MKPSSSSSFAARRGVGSGSGCTPFKMLLWLSTVLVFGFIALILPQSPINILPDIPSAPTLTKQVIPSSSAANNQNLHQHQQQQQQQQQQQLNTVQATHTPKRKPKVAIAITVTKDGPFVDGALVLGFAAQKFHSARFGHPSAYEIELVAFVTRSVRTTRTVLAQFGWKVLERELPVALAEIENKNYMESMRSSGCCGADEFLKLWAYTLTDYHRVLHLDMDSIIFQNLDALFNLDFELLYTGDYNMKAGSPVAPAQGGFLLIRPSMERFEEFCAVIRKGDHRPGGGWGGSGIGNFWGGQTIQGIVPYLYHTFHPHDAKELNRCQYNQMVDNPYHRDTTRCLDGQPTCEDCRLSEVDSVFSAHFTICQKPWTCTAHTNPRNMRLCRAFHEKWFSLRDEFEQAMDVDVSYRVKRSVVPGSLRMCRNYGDDKYLPLPIDKVVKLPSF
jgi:hypothetical protein